MEVSTGQIFADVGRYVPKFGWRDSDILLSKLRISASKTYGGELKYYKPLSKKAPSCATVMLKIADFSKRTYRYYWPQEPSSPLILAYTCEMFWLDDNTVLLVFAGLSGLCYEKHNIDRVNKSIQRVWTQYVFQSQPLPLLLYGTALRMLNALNPAEIQIMPNLLVIGDQSYIVTTEKAMWDFRFYSVSDDGGEIVMNIPKTINVEKQIFNVALKNRMVLNGCAYFVANRKEANVPPSNDQEYLLRVNIVDIKLTEVNWFMNIDRDRFEAVKFPKNGLSFAACSAEWIVYQTDGKTEINYFAIDLQNFVWKSLDVTAPGNVIAIVDGSSLITFKQYSVPGYPLNAVPLNFRIEGNVLDSNVVDSAVAGHLTKNA